MNKKDDWQQVIREVHLFGGARAINNIEPFAHIFPKTTDGKLANVKLEGFGSLFEKIKNLRIGIIGCDFYTNTIEIKGINPPQWRTKSLVGSGWPCTDQGMKWSFIAHSAFKQKDALFCDVASRISHQLMACEWRLRQLSESYNEQLNSRLKDSSYKDGERFANGYTSLCYLAFQAFLVDACILRDYLSEFYWIAKGQTEAEQRVTTLGGLIRKWKQAIPNDPVARELKASADKGNWLFELGAFRDLVVHSAPLAHADRTLFAVCRSFDMPQGRELPGIKLPIPNNPSEISGGRSSGRYFEDPELNFARFTNALEDSANARDALEYAHISMQLISALAETISSTSPFEPEIPTFSKKDIIGDIKIIEDI